VSVVAEAIAPFFVGRDEELATLRSTFSRRRRGVVVVSGLPGTGKTALAMMFLHHERDLFPGGVAHVYGPDTTTLTTSPAHIFSEKASRALLVVDEAERMTAEGGSELWKFFHANPRLNLLLLTTDRSLHFAAAVNLRLDGLNHAAYRELLTRRLATVAPEIVDQLWQLTEGNALIGDIASRTVRENIMTWNQLLQAMQGFWQSGILGPDGRSVDSSIAVPAPIVSAVSSINAEVLEMLRRDPSRVRSLSPRQFEELVAELLTRIGYEVELTPFSGDGGFDMYAARTDSLGRFLFLVECKRYTPPEAVGVRVVRSLHGVVQLKRANAGVIATTSFFTKGAKALQAEITHQMHLADYFQLQRWLNAPFADSTV
jgi:HJR/Mrr/RecB family endonuclease